MYLQEEEKKVGEEWNVGLLSNETMEKTDVFLAADIGQPESW